MSEAEQARRYERAFPGALSDESQKAARQDRMDYKSRPRRTITVPELPWKREKA